MYGIYARQSVEKRDSVSIEMQIELCRKLVPDGADVQVYEDRGYTGTNTNRPAFQRMRKEICSGHISGVIVYKLDRISRSLSDFARLSEELELYHVKLISYGENFDTGSPMGMMLVRMLILFAEMEQKTISARIRDNYYTRAEMKKALGGVPPYGYAKDWTIHPQEAAVVLSTFQDALCGKSLDRIARRLSNEKIPSPKGIRWTGAQVGRMLHRAAYVKSNAAVYAYFQRHAAKLLHPAEDFCKACGCITIQANEGLVVAAGTHEGIVPAEIWLAVQELLHQKKPSCNGGSGNTSWLQGLIVCGKCGQSCYVRSNGKGKPYVYFVCRGKRLGLCSGLRAMRTYSVEKAAEQLLAGEVQRLLAEDSDPAEESILEGCSLDTEIAEILRFLQEHPDSAEEMSPQLEALCRRRNQQNIQMRRRVSFPQNNRELWKTLSAEQKKSIAHLLLKNVILTEERMTLIFR